MARTMLGQALSCAVVGSAETVRNGLAAFIARTGADELMVTAQIFDHAARAALVRDRRRGAPDALPRRPDQLCRASGAGPK